MAILQVDGGPPGGSGLSVGGQLLFCEKFPALGPLSAIDEICIAIAPAFERVIGEVDATFNVCGWKPMLFDEIVSDGKLMPVPLSDTFCGEFDALSTNEMEAAFEPVDAGANKTLIPHSPAIPTLPPLIGQVVPEVILNSAEFGPLMEMALTCKGKLPVLFKATDCGPLALPTLSDPKFSADGATLAVGAGADPIPVNCTACVAVFTFPELSVNTMLALKVPIVSGAN
jgi:hypothetical protein